MKKQRATSVFGSGVGLCHFGTAQAAPAMVRAWCLTPGRYCRHLGLGLPVPLQIQGFPPPAWSGNPVVARAQEQAVAPQRDETLLIKTGNSDRKKNFLETTDCCNSKSHRLNCNPNSRAHPQ